MNSGRCKISISSWMYDLSIYCGCIFVLVWMSYSIKNLSKRRVYLGSYCGSLRGAWRTTGSKGFDKSECLSSKVYGFS